MALPFAFEESVFEEGGGASRGRGPLASPYSARCCEPEWFCEQVNCQDDLESISIKKFRGDLAYKQQEFQKALQEYSSCLALVPPSNTAMRRDLKESQARCLAHLGKHEEALRIAENLRDEATNTDHVTAIFNLQYAIYRLLGDIEKIIGCLQRLILLHPFHPRTWNLLAEAYMSSLRFPAPLSGAKAGMSQSDGLIAGPCLHGSSEEASFPCHPTQSLRKDDPWPSSVHTDDSSGSCVECQSVQRPIWTLGNSGPRPTMKRASTGPQRLKEICVYACASFVRARLLFQLMQLTQSSFALENNLKTQQEIEDNVRSFGWEADVLSLMTELSSPLEKIQPIVGQKSSIFSHLTHIGHLLAWLEVMGEDLVRDKLKEDAQEEVKYLSPSALTSVMTTSAVEFERKWFQKLRGCLSRMDRQT